MKIKDVLANEMVQLGFRIRFPIGIKIQVVTVAQCLETCEIANRCIQPHVKIFSRVSGNFEPEVGFISGYVPVPQSRIKPLSQLVDDLAL